jgi:alcohol dehydrogenase class IV
VPHGITSCVVLPAVLAWYGEAGAEAQARISDLLGAWGTPAAEAVRGLAARLGLPTDLKSVGVGRDQFQAIAEHTMHDRGVRTGARPITGPGDIVEILELAAG